LRVEIVVGIVTLTIIFMSVTISRFEQGAAYFRPPFFGLRRFACGRKLKPQADRLKNEGKALEPRVLVR
jgi:hypothetical protein